MKDKEIVFKRERVASLMKVGKNVLTNLRFEQFEHEGDCVIRDKIVMRLESELYKKTIAEKEIIFFMDRPTFFDWLFRRRKIKTVKVNISDVLNNPPMTDGDVTRFYNYEKLD